MTKLTNSLIIKAVLLTTLVLAFIEQGYAQNSRKALFIIDVQTNFLDIESKIHIDTLSVGVLLKNVNLAINHFEKENNLVIYITNEWTSALKNWVTGNVSKKGAPGTEISADINIVNTNIFSKSKGNALTNEHLLSLLKDKEIAKVYITGLFAEGCVKATVKGLIKEGFKPIVIEDALGSKNLQKKEKVLSTFKQLNIELTKTADI